MAGASNIRPTPKRALLYNVDPSLASSLEQELMKCGCQTEFASGTAPEAADIVFCAADRSVLREALELFPGTPVVVVSRLPDVERWLDALEDGAADYCAPPFEAIQMRWLLDTHAGARRRVAVA
jgi:DNA-binding NtrC family response regulator